MNAATLESVPLDFKTPFDELTELREVLSNQEIAEMTGLRRETISRARPDSRFQRRTEKALGDLYAVVMRMRSVNGGELGQLAAILRRPQASLGFRSIAELLKEGKVDLILDSLAEPSPTEAEPPAADPESEKVAALLGREPELRAQLGAIEAAILRRFGPGARIERKVPVYYDDPEPEEHLYLRVHTDLPFDEEMDIFGEFLGQEQALLEPVRQRLLIGFMG